jgi:hypothetical protein
MQKKALVILDFFVLKLVYNQFYGGIGYDEG